jgi:hypothetical protein
MQETTDVPDYDPVTGVRMEWEADSIILVTVDSEVVIRANRPGLRSLARLCLAMAQERVVPGAHFHLDEFSGCEAGSSELILERT